MGDIIVIILVLFTLKNQVIVNVHLIVLWNNNCFKLYSNKLNFCTFAIVTNGKFRDKIVIDSKDNEDRRNQKSGKDYLYYNCCDVSCNIVITIYK